MTIPLTTTGGKGSSQRPTDRQLYEANWEIIFGKKDLLDEKMPITDDKIPTVINVHDDI
jgi:hypothetical protein